MSNHISIIIPTHERQHILTRALSYYEQFIDVDLIVCDSSLIPTQIVSNHKKILYYHLPRYGFADKILFGILRSNSQYICLSADDDFLSYSALKSGETFLNSHNDYVSVQGMYVQFTYINIGKVIFDQLYAKNNNQFLESDYPEDRVVASMKPYIQQLYSLHRKEALEKAIDLATKAPEITNVEVACNLVPMIYGKHKVLDEFWMARDSNRYTTYNFSSNNQNTVIKNYRDYFETEEGNRFIVNYGKLYSQITNASYSNGEALFKAAFEKYFQGSLEKTIRNQKKQKSLKNIFRIFIPIVFLYYRRKLIMDKVSFGGQKTLKTFDWNRMKTTILKFGSLREESDIRI
jgi:glycosyltransferase domain-containing protein